MKYALHFSDDVLADIRRATNYIRTTLNNEPAAYALNNLTITTAKNIPIFPKKYPIIDDVFLKLHQIRCAPVKNYLLFYQIREHTQTIYLVRFLYAKSNWYKILKDNLKTTTYTTNDSTYFVHEAREPYGTE